MIIDVGDRKCLVIKKTGNDKYIVLYGTKKLYIIYKGIFKIMPLI